MAKKYNIAVIPGDGIGPEITKAAIDVLEAATSKREIEIFTKELKAGGAAVDLYGIPLPQETIDKIKSLDRDAQYYWDFVYVENAEGAHNSTLSNYCLDKAEDLAKQALALLK